MKKWYLWWLPQGQLIQLLPDRVLSDPLHTRIRKHRASSKNNYVRMTDCLLEKIRSAGVEQAMELSVIFKQPGSAYRYLRLLVRTLSEAGEMAVLMLDDNTVWDLFRPPPASTSSSSTAVWPLVSSLLGVPGPLPSPDDLSMGRMPETASPRRSRLAPAVSHPSSTIA